MRVSVCECVCVSVYECKCVCVCVLLCDLETSTVGSLVPICYATNNRLVPNFSSYHKIA